MENKYILGIETSCDETSAAIVKNGTEVLSNIVNTQLETHQRFGVLSFLNHKTRRVLALLGEFLVSL